MPHWKSILAYDGTTFHGWQVQPGLRTIQGTLAEMLRQLTGETVLPQGSGRTDAGVHALGQVASFTLQSTIPGTNLQRALNGLLPASIRILSLEPADESFHARHCARRKTYEYRVFPRVPAPRRGRPENRALPDRICPPTLAPYAWDHPWPLDLERARRAAREVLGVHDFTSFAAADPDRETRGCNPQAAEGDASTGFPPRTNVREIFASDWSMEDGLLVYRVTGSGFLHHMVRNLTGTCLDAAAGRTEPEGVAEILASRDRTAAGPTAPARGLFLRDVEY